MMERPSYLPHYMFEWELFEVVLKGKSALDTNYFIGPMRDIDQVNSFLKGYGLDPSDPVGRAELFGNFQEAVQFIKKYFLVEGNPEGMELKIPNSIFMITDIGDLFLMATGNSPGAGFEEMLWAEAILKVMHTILHADKDLRSNYFSIIQTQIFDRYYRFIYRDENNQLFLGVKGENSIPLVDFETKSKKSRDSIIIKLLHKAENVAEELFDRIGVRIVTEGRFDILRVLKFLMEQYVIVPHNIKPSRSLNSIFDLATFKIRHGNLVRMALRNGLSEERFLQALEREIMACPLSSQGPSDRNHHTSSAYQAIQFTCRQLIKYKNPFLQEFRDLREFAKTESDSELAKKVLGMDQSLIARDVRFFYPYEIQIMDRESHKNNTEGEASHQEYKRSQVQSAMKRVFSRLIKYKGISFS
jgi:uncharacterized protein (TIGR04562 family)